jgi:predicted negative regulator of RcsB-dependent stress response
VDRATRKELKGDKFAEEVFDVFDWASVHKAEVVRYGAIILAVVAIGIGYFFYNRSQADVREQALADALRTEDGMVGGDTGQQPAVLHYATQDEKDKAVIKAYNDVASKYSGSTEGSIAAIALANVAANKGDMAEAEKRYRAVADNGPKAYASMARLALARVLVSENKTAEAEKILKDLQNDPTITVSKETATLALAQAMAKSDPAGALKMLDPLRTSPHQAVSRVAVTEYGQIDQTIAANKK